MLTYVNAFVLPNYVGSTFYQYTTHIIFCNHLFNVTPKAEMIIHIPIKSLNSISERENSDEDINGKLFSTMIHITFQVLLFFIGTFIQIKIISICKEEKCATLQIHVIHSIILIINFACNISFDLVIYFYHRYKIVSLHP